MRHDARRAARQDRALDGRNDIDACYKALVEWLSRYPVTDPAARVPMLAEVVAVYRQERAATTVAVQSPRAV